jgi:hypothetical protein
VVERNRKQIGITCELSDYLSVWPGSCLGNAAQAHSPNQACQATKPPGQDSWAQPCMNGSDKTSPASPWRHRTGCRSIMGNLSCFVCSLQKGARQMQSPIRLPIIGKSPFSHSAMAASADCCTNEKLLRAMRDPSPTLTPV